MSSSLLTSSTISREGGGVTSSFDVEKLLEEAKNRPGEIQHVNYRGCEENNNCDFDLLILNENYHKDRLNEFSNDRLHFHHTYGAVKNVKKNFTTMEGQAGCTP